MENFKRLTDENFDQAMAFCCAKTPKRVKRDDHKAVASEALKRLRAELESRRDDLPMGCSIEAYEAHVDAAIDKVHAQMREDQENPACGFAFIAVIGFIASLLSIWRFIREYLLTA